MSHWNYRVFRHPDGSLAIHEAHYDEDRELPVAWTANPEPVLAEDLDSLRETLQFMQRALDRPILNLKDEED